MVYFKFAELIGSVPILARVAAAISPLQLVRAAARLHKKFPWKPSCKMMKEHRISSALQSTSVEPLEPTWLEMETIFKRPVQRRKFQIRCPPAKVLSEWKSDVENGQISTLCAVESRPSFVYRNRKMLLTPSLPNSSHLQRVARQSQHVWSAMSRLMFAY